MSIDEYEDEIREDIIKKLKQSEEDYKNGRWIDSDTLFRELRQKYRY